MIAQHFIFDIHRPEVLMDAFKEASVLWKKHGAQKCENTEQMGNCMDGLATDADFAAWQGKYFGTSTLQENVIARMIAEGKKSPFSGELMRTLEKGF